MQNVATSLSNPFGFDPGCAEWVPGYGDANADFHVFGDHPGVHGGVETGVPFTDVAAAERLQRALADGGILNAAGTVPDVGDAFLSYLYPCVPRDGREPTDADYDALEPVFDAELRAITAHVLLPVGERATRYAFANYTSRDPDSVAMDDLHATEVPGSGWLVYPIADPAGWSDADEERLVTALRDLLASDYRREADLGRFQPGGDPYLVR